MSLQVKVDDVSNIELALSYMTLPHRTDGIDMDIGDYRDGLCEKLIKAGDDHGKHMRMIQVWMRVRAPRYWWVEFDTYRIGVEKVSESTMHTLKKTVREVKDYHEFKECYFAEGALWGVVHDFYDLVRMNPRRSIELIKANLPESWMQTRGVMVNYQTLRRIHHQRKDHRLSIWRSFLRQVLRQVPHPEWITDGEDYL